MLKLQNDYEVSEPSLCITLVNNHAPLLDIIGTPSLTEELDIQNPILLN